MHNKLHFSLWWSRVPIPKIVVMTWKYTWNMGMCSWVQLTEIMPKWLIVWFNWAVCVQLSFLNSCFVAWIAWMSLVNSLELFIESYSDFSKTHNYMELVGECYQVARPLPLLLCSIVRGCWSARQSSAVEEIGLCACSQISQIDKPKSWTHY